MFECFFPGTLKILIKGVFDVVSEPLVVSTNEQVLDGEDACVDDYIGDYELNKINKITKNIDAHYKDNDGCGTLYPDIHINK